MAKRKPQNVKRRRRARADRPAAPPAIRDRIVRLDRIRARDLLPADHNWGEHPAKQRKALAAALQTLGYVDAVLARETRGGRLKLIDGHLRAETTPDDLVPVLVLDVTKKEADLILATFDPIGQMRETGRDNLRKLLAGMATPAGDLGDLVADLRTLAGAPEPAAGQADPPAEIDRPAELKRKWETAAGQLWAIEGKLQHRLLCGDATQGAALELLTGGEPFDAVLTDPPYSSGGQFRSDRSKTTDAKYNLGDGETCRTNFAGDNRDQRAFVLWANLWLTELFRLSKPGGVALVFTDWRQIPVVTDAVQCAGWIWRNLVTWYKPGCRHQKGRFSSSAEYIVYASNGPVTPGDASPANVLTVPGVVGKRKDHIAQKPVELLRLLLGVTPAGATIVDPFLGSGSTLIAAEQTGRRCLGVEIDPAYCAVTLQRAADLGLACKLIDGPKPRRRKTEPAKQVKRKARRGKKVK